MTFAEKMQRDAVAATRPGRRTGENVEYYFAAGGQRTIHAEVSRQGRVRSDDGDLVYEVTIVVIPNHATNGVTAIADGDEIEVAMREGGVAERCRNVSLISQDAGAWTLEVSP